MVNGKKGGEGMSVTTINFAKGISPLSDTQSAIAHSLKQTDATSETGRIKMMNFLELMHPQATDNSVASKAAPIKTLFDHGHSNRNKMVIYDDDPRVEAVMKAALDRHNGKLRDHEEFLKKTEEKQQQQNEIASRHSNMKKHEIEKHREEMRQVLE